MTENTAPAGNAISVSIRQKSSASYDPSYDGWPIPYGHWQSAYAYENHERSCGDVYEVGMYVSLNYFFTLPEFPSRPRVTIPVAGERDGKGKKIVPGKKFPKKIIFIPRTSNICALRARTGLQFRSKSTPSPRARNANFAHKIY